MEIVYNYNDISPQNYTLGCTLTLLTQKIVTNGIFACCHVVCHTSSSPRSHYSLIKGDYYFSLLDIIDSLGAEHDTRFI